MERDTALSVVMPVLDEAPTIAARLEALHDLRASGAQVVVVDGGSADSTVAIARAFADIVITAPRGRASQMNAGAAAATGAVLLFLHADARLPARAGELIEEVLGTEPPRSRDGRHRGPAYHWGRFDVRIDSRRPVLRMVSAAMNWRSHLTGIATGDQAIFVRRTLFDSVGGFPDIALMEDIALSRALRRSGRPARIRECVFPSPRGWEQRGAWRTIVLMWRLRLAYRFGADPRELAVRYGYRPREHAAPAGAPHRRSG